MNEEIVCDYCERPIQDDHYYEINGDVICQGCLDEYFRKEMSANEQIQR